MGFSKILIFEQRIQHLTVSLIFCMIFISSQSRLFIAEGRSLAQTADNSEMVIEDQKALILRAQIGSRPPHCEGRCVSCTHCEAIQVPVNPQTKHRVSSSAAALAAAAYVRRADASNYKPMSWKCKCGSLIFNP